MHVCQAVIYVQLLPLIVTESDTQKEKKIMYTCNEYVWYLHGNFAIGSLANTNQMRKEPYKKFATDAQPFEKRTA